MSRAILEVTEGKILKEIETKWFGKKTSCPDLYTQVSSSSLGLESFWGLFLIAGVSSLLALAIHAFIFFHGHWHIIKSSTPAEASIWDRIRIAVRVFDQKDMNSHTFRDSSTQMPELQGNCGNINRVLPIEAIGDTNNCQPGSPSSYLNQSDFNFVGFSSEQETLPIEDGTLNQAPLDTQFSVVQIEGIQTSSQI